MYLFFNCKFVHTLTFTRELLKAAHCPRMIGRERRADGQYSRATKAAKWNWAAEIIWSSKRVLTLSLGHEQRTGAEPGGRGFTTLKQTPRDERGMLCVRGVIFICYIKPKCLNFICIPHTWFLSVTTINVLQNKLWMLLWQSYAWKFKKKFQ